MRYWKNSLLISTALAALNLFAASAMATDGTEKQVGPAIGSQTATFVATQSTPPSAAGTTTCTTIRVTAAGPLFADGFESGDTQAWGSSGGGGGSFSVAAFEDLRFEVLFSPGSSGDHLLHLDLKTPRDHQYQRLTVPVSGLASQRGTTRKVEGFPYPLTVQGMTPVGTAGDSGVALSLPVAGTVIVSSALYGSWTAEALLDGETEPCASVTFTLTP